MSDDQTPVPQTDTAGAASQPPKPKRRRRTKAEMEEARAKEAAKRAAAEAAGLTWPPKRKRGRPSKAELTEAKRVEAAVEAVTKLQKTMASSEERKEARAPRTAEREVQAAPQGFSPSNNPESPRGEKPERAEKGRFGRKRRRPGDHAGAERAARAEQNAPQREGFNNVSATGAAQGTGEQASRAAQAADKPAPQPAEAQQNGFKNKGSNGNSNYQNRRQNNFKDRRNRNNRKQEAPAGPSVSREELIGWKVAELRQKAAELDLEYIGVRKKELIELVYDAAARAEGYRPVKGILEIGNEGYGWVRTGNYMEGDDDAFVHQQLIRSFGLRPGDCIEGTVGPGRANSKYPPLQIIKKINDADPERAKRRPRFRDLTPVYPNERLVMECGKDSITGRAIDLVSPIGKGQRGLIVSPPKAGKTTVLKKICKSITSNNPEVKLFCLLVDERPEEVTDMQRSIDGTVVASTFDMPAENHTHVSELVIEHAKRLVEDGMDVVVVLDSITRLARAYNLAQPASGRILSGGVDSAALYPPKKFLGAARNIENGGSLTIIASALVDTGSKMDEVIFEEFKGTGNMELKLDRELADKRIFPAIDPVASGTRNEDLLIDPEYQPLVWGIRRVLANMNNTERAANALVKGLKGTDNNRDFLIRSAKKAQQTDYTA